MPSTFPASFPASSNANRARAIVDNPVPSKEITWAKKSVRYTLLESGDTMFIGYIHF